jgi:hypothetical protein
MKRTRAALVIPAMRVVAAPLLREGVAPNGEHRGVILVEDQLTILGVDGEAPSLIEDRESEERRRPFRSDASDPVMQLACISCELARQRRADSGAKYAGR